MDPYLNTLTRKKSPIMITTTKLHPLWPPSEAKHNKHLIASVVEDVNEESQFLRKMKLILRFGSYFEPSPSKDDCLSICLFLSVDCPSQQDVDKILERIGNNPSLKKIMPIPIKKHLPKRIIYGLEKEFTKEEMEAALSQTFKDIHKDLKVLFLIKGRTGKIHWVFQTPVYIYRQLRRKQKLTIESTRKPIQSNNS
ncbi:hypothetical protein AVEN_115295-1 [Araneus ventricosus]|uniref:Uncharacterized protein n=1 Tax=Araneus ventricosus TaxID=182803 RepID=A0A4Y1ZYJ9_ARAVE|nr:hypothetical protein AVEN_115295-1 [Araneus ventricosus]